MLIKSTSASSCTRKVSRMDVSYSWSTPTATPKAVTNITKRGQRHWKHHYFSLRSFNFHSNRPHIHSLSLLRSFTEYLHTDVAQDEELLVSLSEKDCQANTSRDQSNQSIWRQVFITREVTAKEGSSQWNVLTLVRALPRATRRTKGQDH